MEERVEPDPRAGLEDPRLGRQVGRIERPLEERLDARDEDPGPARPPRGERRDPGRGLVGDELAPLVGQRAAGLEDGHGVGVAEPRPQLLRDTVADLGVAGDPDHPLGWIREGERGREERLGAVRDRRQPGVPAAPVEGIPGPPEPLAERGERPGRGQQRWERGQVGQPATALRLRRGGGSPERRGGTTDGSSGIVDPARFFRPGALPGFGRRRASGFLRTDGVLDLAVGLGHVEVDRFIGPRPVAGEKVLGDTLAQPALGAALAPERRRRHASSSGAGPVVCLIPRSRPVAACASRSASGGSRRVRAARRPRRPVRSGPCRPVGAGTR